MNKKYKHKPTGSIAKYSTAYHAHIVDYNGSISRIDSWMLESSNDWEEVKEKEYEILVMKYNDDLYYLSNNVSEYYNNQFKYMIKGGTGFLVESGLFDEDSEVTIHSVKRLSDGEVFTIEDKAKIKGQSNSEAAVIVAMKINGANPNTIYVSGGGLRWGQNIDKLEKVTPIFVTEDGVDMFLGDRYYFVFKGSSNDYISTGITTPGKYVNDLFMRFSTEDACQAYLDSIKPIVPDYVTEDGVGIKFDTVVHWVTTDDDEGFRYLYELAFGKHHIVSNGHICNLPDTYKVFSTKESAEEFVEENQLLDVKLTKKEVEKLKELLK